MLIFSCWRRKSHQYVMSHDCNLDCPLSVVTVSSHLTSSSWKHCLSLLNVLPSLLLSRQFILGLPDCPSTSVHCYCCLETILCVNKTRRVIQSQATTKWAGQEDTPVKSISWESKVITFPVRFKLQNSMKSTRIDTIKKQIMMVTNRRLRLCTCLNN